MSPRVRPFVLLLVLAYPFWLAMMACHELGHVIGAAMTGGRVVNVSIPLVGFSRTDVDPNPWPRVEIWCGPVVGSLLALAAWSMFSRTRVRVVLQAFAGWCLIANGLYIGVGWVDRVGDAGELVRLGAPVWTLVAFGTFSSVAGLFLWHRLDHKKLGRDAQATEEGTLTPPSPPPP